MIKWYCCECKNAYGNCTQPCIYIDPIGERDYPFWILCDFGTAIWRRDNVNE